MLKPFLIILVAICLSVSGELLLKSGMNQIRVDLGVFSFSNFFPVMQRVLTSPRILSGFAFFGVGSIFWLAALSRVSLSWAYPMLAIGYILILLFSTLILKEHVSLMRWAGALIICLGIILVFRS
jgi:multidrug transporter EmrE-like cation transporter